ncbi:MAG: hypothetical protein JJ974_11820 [Phycisphaerales bacterium]|nr:hypothetical protein [Phycisphaerales bacterium]
MGHKNQSILLFGAIASISTAAQAQWSEFSTIHQVVADGPGEQVQPKISPTLDGGCYISWFSSDSGYDVRLQRLDSAGNIMWANNGILIADRGFSSTQDYGLDTDSNGNAVIAFRDDRFGGVVVTAHSVAPDGTLNWGPNGIQLGSSADSINSPDIASTDDGNVVVGWINNADSIFTQLNPSGSENWSTTLSTDFGDSILVSNMQRSDSGSVIVSWVQYGFFLGPKHLYAQKLAADGSEAWTQRVPVFDGGSLQFGNFPDFVSDGSGGAVFSWYDTANSLDVYAQHLQSDGTESFPHNGASVSTAPRERVSPAATYDPTNNTVLVAWVELENNQGDQGIYAQSLDALGNPLWGSTGKVISAIDNTGSGSVNTHMLGDTLVVSWIENAGGFDLDTVLAFGVNPDGTNAWNSGAAPVATDFNERSRLTATVSTDGFLIAGWQVGPFGSADIETHNVNPDGSLGPASCAADLNDDEVLDFFDISFFLSNTVDYNNDTVFDFFDISAFLTDYGAGCP